MSCCAIANSTDLRSPRRSRCGSDERLHLVLALADARVVRGRERLQVEARASRADRHPAAGGLDVERRVVGQRAQQVLQLARSDGHGLGFLAGEFRMRGDLHLEVGGRHVEAAVLLLEQHIRKNRQRVPPFDDAGDSLQRFQQRIPGGLLELH